MINLFNNKSISPLQYLSLVIISSNALLTGIGMPNILKISKYDSWISIIIGFIIGIPLILLIMYMNKYNLNFFELIDKYFNKFFSKIINFIFIIFLFFILIVALNDFINFANLKYLFETPNIIISILFIIPILYISNKGLETIGRSSFIILIFIIFIHFVNVTALIKLVDIENLKPIFTVNLLEILKGSIYFVIYTIMPIIFISSLQKNNNDYIKYNKSLFLGYVIGSFITLIIMFFITTVYNYKYITLFNYPAYFTIKKIEYGFISNAENIQSFVFIINYFFFILTLVYILFNYIKNVIKIKKLPLKITNIILTILIIILPVNALQSTFFARLISEKYLLIISLVFMIIYFTIIPLKIKLTKKSTN